MKFLEANLVEGKQQAWWSEQETERPHLEPHAKEENKLEIGKTSDAPSPPPVLSLFQKNHTS